MEKGGERMKKLSSEEVERYYQKKEVKEVLVFLIITIARWLLTFIIIIALARYLIWVIPYQFEIYQKKHGDKMTFTEFIFDSGK
jgi:hypothetical protein